MCIVLRTQVLPVSINRVRQTAVVRIRLPEQSRAVHVLLGRILPALSCTVPRHSDVSR